MAFYLDTSALVKVVVGEPETAALRAWLGEEDRMPVACDLVRTELVRAVRRGAPDRLALARSVLEGVTLLNVTTALFESAGRVDPLGLGSLDALHLAAALDIGDELRGVVTYDERLADASAANGVTVLAAA